MHGAWASCLRYGTFPVSERFTYVLQMPWLPGTGHTIQLLPFSLYISGRQKPQVRHQNTHEMNAHCSQARHHWHRKQARGAHIAPTPVGQHRASESPACRVNGLAGVTLSLWGWPGRSALNRRRGVRRAVAPFLSLCEDEVPTGAAANAGPCCPGGGARARRTKLRRGQSRPPSAIRASSPVL